MLMYEDTIYPANFGILSHNVSNHYINFVSQRSLGFSLANVAFGIQLYAVRGKAHLLATIWARLGLGFLIGQG
jgi:hypothetical protein